jgi:signal transduction histidine kinase
VELSAYRIIQEALTNTRKYAGPAHAEVTVRYRHEAAGPSVVQTSTSNPRSTSLAG